MSNLIKMESRNLNSIMNSAGFGTVTTGGSGIIKKSFLFAGLALIKSALSSDYRSENLKARTEFANSMIKEFGIEPDSFDERFLKSLYTGSDKNKPLSIRDAQRIITGIGGKSREMQEYLKVVQKYNSDAIDQLMLQSLADKKTFSEDVGVASKSVLKNTLVKIRDKAGSDSMSEMTRIVEAWLKLSGREPTPTLVTATLKELELHSDVKADLKTETSSVESHKEVLEAVMSYWEDMAATGLNELVRAEITNFTVKELKLKGLDTSEESVQKMLREAGVFKR